MKDLLYNFDDGTIFKNGDLNVGECDQQNQQLLLVCEKGSFKEFPATCVGVQTYLESEDLSGLLREVVTQFTGDGMKVNAAVIANGKLDIDANY